MQRVTSGRAYWVEACPGSDGAFYGASIKYTYTSAGSWPLPSRLTCQPRSTTAGARRESSYAPSSLGCSGGGRRLRCVYLEVTLLNGQNYSIPVEEGHSVEEELELFLSRDGRYAGDWVPLQKASRQLFVRYEQIVLVSPTG